jgi:hypothetical protein
MLRVDPLCGLVDRHLVGHVERHTSILQTKGITCGSRDQPPSTRDVRVGAARGGRPPIMVGGSAVAAGSRRPFWTRGSDASNRHPCEPSGR